MGKQRMSTGCQKLCTISYVFTWLLLLIGLILYHTAISQTVPHIKDLPDNLKKGFYEVLGFNAMEAETLNVKDAAREALQKCGVTPPCTCSPPTGGGPPPCNAGLQTSSTTAEKQKMSDSFMAALANILKVTEDPYFGTPDLQSTATDLRSIETNIQSIPSANTPCAGTNPMYCEIYRDAHNVFQEVDPVKKQIDGFIDGDLIKDFKDNADRLNYLHGLPYLLVLSAIFFAFFWWKYATCCCCKGGGCCGCILLILHAIFWLISFVLNTVVFAICVVMMFGQDKVNVSFLNGNPTLEVFLEHLQSNYPTFWNLVFEDLEAGCVTLWRAVAAFEVFMFIIVAYGLCLCVVRPYKDSDEAKVVAM